MFYTTSCLLIAPLAALIAYWFYVKRLDNISAGLLGTSFGAGVLAFVPLLILNLVFNDLGIIAAGELSDKLIYASTLGFFKEWLQYLFVLWLVSQSPMFDEPYKGVAYTLMAALGFASAENVADLFFFNNLQVMSPLLATPLYGISAVLIGYGLGQSKNFGAGILIEIRGLILAVLLHTICLFSVICRFEKLLEFSVIIALLVAAIQLFKAIKIRERALAFEAYAKSV